MFPVHGTRFGPGAQVLAGDAARALFVANLLARTADVPVWRAQVPVAGGVVQAQVAGPLAFKGGDVPDARSESKGGDEEDTPNAFARLMWVPEGFSITPKTPQAPDGMGLPYAADGQGTPGGPMPAVMLNCKQGNNYPDVIFGASKPVQALGAVAKNLGRKLKVHVICGDFAPTRWELTQDWRTTYKKDGLFFGYGVLIPPQELSTALVVDYQFRSPGAAYQSRFQEADAKKPDGSAQWFCHRPMAAQLAPVDSALLQRTNAFRKTQGQPPLMAPLRHTVGELAYDIAYQMQYGGFHKHDSEFYREGRKTFELRSENVGVFGMYGENVVQMLGVSGAKAVEVAVTAWENSPPHRAAMLTDWSQDAGAGPGWPTLDPALVRGGVAEGGALGAQLFRGEAEWAVAGEGERDAQPVVTTFSINGGRGRQPFVYAFVGANLRLGRTYTPAVAFLGRAIILTPEPVDALHLAALSGAVVYPEDPQGEVLLRVAMRCTPGYDHVGPGGLASIQIWQGPLRDFAAQREVLAEYMLPDDYSAVISKPAWAPSGRRCVFSVTTAQRDQGAIFTANEQQPPLAGNLFYGDSVAFIEFDGTAFVHHGADSLYVTPQTARAADGTVGTYNVACSGSYRFSGHYVLQPGATPGAAPEEALVYTRAVVDSFIRYQKGGACAQQLFCKLVFHDGQEFVCVRQGDDLPLVQRFVRHILAYDDKHPELMAYAEYGVNMGAGYPLEMRVKVGDTLLRAAQVVVGDVRPAPSGALPAPPPRPMEFLSPTSCTTARAEWFGTPNEEGGLTEYIPSAPFKALLMPRSNRTPRMRRLVRNEDAVSALPFEDFLREAVMSGFFVGPTVLWDDVGLWPTDDRDQPALRTQNFGHYCRYGVHALHYGCAENSYYRPGMYSTVYTGSGWEWRLAAAWEGDARWYYHDNFGAKEAVGLPDMLDDVLPMGVI